MSSEIERDYAAGMSIPEISEKTGMSRSTVRYHIKKAGLLRTRGDGVRNAAKKGRLGATKGRRREFTEEWKDNIRKSKLRHGEEHAKGSRVNSNGYMEYTRGEHKGRMVHVVRMEELLGRRIKRGECVHHIDGDKLNNEINNLAFMTMAAHSRLHRLEEMKAGETRERRANGTWN